MMKFLKRTLAIIVIVMIITNFIPTSTWKSTVRAASNLKICGVDIGIATNTLMQFTSTANGTNSNSGYYYKGKYLGASQCFGFARWCQYKLFNAISYANRDEKYIENSKNDFYWISANGISNVPAGKLTVSKLKTLINASKPGAHIRTNGSTQHSMVITAITSTGFSIAQCNGSNNNEYSGYKQNYVGTYTYTWQSYVDSTYGSRGIQYIEMPYKYTYDLAPIISSAKGINTSEITIKWNKVNTATKYKVERRKAAEEEYVVVKSSTTDTTFTDTGLETGKRYWYRVTSYNGSTKLATSEKVGVYTKFSAPNLEAVSDSKLKISWKSVSKAVDYTIMRRKSGDEEYEEIKTVAETSYTDSGLSANTKYFYWIQANCDLDGTEIIAKSISNGQFTLTKAPTIKSVKGISKTEIQITWNNVSGADTYRIARRKAGESDYVNLKSGLTTTSYNDTGLEKNQRYFYLVYAKNSAGESSASARVGGYTKFDSPTITAVGTGQLKLTWDSVSRAESYTIKRRHFSGEYTDITTVPGTSFTDTGLEPGTQFYYYIQANCNIGGEERMTAKSESQGQYTKLMPPDCYNIMDTSLKVHWYPIHGSDTYSYVVQRKAPDESDFKTIVTVKGCDYTDSGLKPLTFYKYRIQAIDSNNKVCSSSALVDVQTRACRHDYNVNIINSTCTVRGYTKYTCKICGYSYNDNYQSATGHKYSGWVIDKEATCKTEGIISNTCSVCSNKEYAKTSKKSHTPADKWVVEIQPTAKGEGLKKLYCSICNEVIEEEIMPKLFFGDLNGDEKITSADVKIIKNIILGDGEASADEQKAYDVNDDGTFDILDYIYIKKLYQQALDAKSDLNGDGSINSTDVALMKKAVLGTNGLISEDIDFYDLNGNNKLDILDLIRIKKLLANA